MNSYWLRFTLKSDTVFGRGSGVPGLVDQEVALDEHGCPYLHGRTLKGLLNEACADILYALPLHRRDVWLQAANRLFGQPGSLDDKQGLMRVGHAQLPSDLRQVIHKEVWAGNATRGNWTREQVVQALTAVRQQTALQPDGSPDPNSLRSVRVILRETPFEAQLSFDEELTKSEKGLLAACVKGFRRAGTARNRGRGRLEAHLETEVGEDLTDDWYRIYFKQEV